MTARILTLLLAASLPLAAADAQESANSFTALSGTEIVDSTGKTMGTLRDIIVGSDGRIVQILVGQGGVLGMGETMRAMNVTMLPAVTDGRIRADGVSAETVASLPEYKETPLPAAAQDGPPPVSGANQQAPQSASTHIPVNPSAVEPPPPTPAPTPAEMPPTVASADASEVEAAVAVQEEKSSPGSGSSGMVPQQGTGSGLPQVSPSADEGGGRDEGVAGADGGKNAMYGRESSPENQPPPESSAGRATTDARAPEATADPDQQKPESSATIPAGNNTQWRIGRIVGATVHGDRDGLSVKDILFSGRSVGTAVIARTGLPDISVPFDTLNIGGTADEPRIALGSDSIGN